MIESPVDIVLIISPCDPYVEMPNDDTAKVDEGLVKDERIYKVILVFAGCP